MTNYIGTMTPEEERAWAELDQRAACARPAPDIRPAVVRMLANNLRNNAYDVAARTMEDLLARVEFLRAALDAQAAQLAAYPADWREDSSLETWFPLTAEQLTAQTAEIERLRKDAERYRWLRERWGRITETYAGDSGRIVEIGTEPEGHGWDVEPETLDAAIDAAMRRTTGSEK